MYVVGLCIIWALRVDYVELPPELIVKFLAII
jgi:hypothetical protein